MYVNNSGDLKYENFVCCVNGELVDPESGSISALDHSIIVGDGVFETVQVVDGVPFALSRHLRRLWFSCEGLGLVPPDEDLIRSSLESVLEADTDAGLVRITWSSGPGSLSSSRGDGPGTLIVATQPAKQWPDSEAVHVCRWTRNENAALVGLKTTSYAENVLALKAAQEQGCSEALFLNTAGFLCEGTGSNIFVVIDGTLVTPPLSSGCLAGITREIVLELVEVVERDVHPSEFSSISEAFLSSSTRDVVPVARIDDFELPNVPGLITSEVMVAFAALKAARLDP